MDDVDDRVREIIELILQGEWGGGPLLRYAKERGVPIGTVKGWSAQAWRVLRFLRGDNDEYRERLLHNLDFAGKLALSLKRTWVGKDGEPFESEAPDVKAYIAAQVEQARLLRLDKPDESEGTEQLPVEQLAAALRALGFEVKAPNAERSDDERQRQAAEDEEREGDREE